MIGFLLPASMEIGRFFLRVARQTQPDGNCLHQSLGFALALENVQKTVGVCGGGQFT